MAPQKFSYALKNGKTLELEGDAPPSDSEVEAIAKEQGVELVPADASPSTTPSMEGIPTGNVPANLTPATPDIPQEKPDERGMLRKMWDFGKNRLTDLPSRIASGTSEYLTNPNHQIMTPNGEGGLHDYMAGTLARLRGFEGGAIQGIGDLVSDLTSPINLGTTLATGGSGMAAKAGFPAVSGALGMIAKGLSAPIVAEGAVDTFSPSSTWGERGRGLLEIAGGMAGMHGLPESEINLPKNTGILTEKPAAIPEVPATKPTVQTPTSQVSASQVPKLPGDLRGAKPRFNMGQDTYIPQFESDLDKALWIIAQDNPSKRNADYLSFAMQHTGLDQRAVMAKAIEVRNAIKAHIKGQEPGEVQIPTIFKVDPPKAPASNAPAMGTVVTFKKGKSGPVEYKKAIEAGFEYIGDDANGNSQFKKTSEPKPGTLPILESELGVSRPTQYSTAQAKRRADYIKELKADTTLSQSDRTRMLQGYDKAHENTNRKGTMAPEKKEHPVVDLLNTPRTIMASGDLSAPLRQGVGLIHKPEYWKAIPDMFRAFGSENAYQTIQDSIRERPLFRPRVGELGEQLPSFAEDAGLKLTDLNDITTREESIMSKFAEKYPGVRRSNRAYTAFLNKLRADTFESLIKDSKVIGTDLSINKPAARDLANFVNTATGRGSLGPAEKHAAGLSTALFSPRLMASRLQYANPMNYMMGTRQAQKEFAKSLLAVATAGNTFLQLGKLAGGKVNTNPSSADYGKLQLGQTRFDPWAGYQQYIVLAQRVLRPEAAKMGSPTDTGVVPVDLMSGFLSEPGGHQKSTNTGVEYSLNRPKFGQSNKADTVLRFARGKTNPLLGTAWGALAEGRELSGEPQDFTTPNPMENTLTKMMIPILWQDLYELVKEEGITPKTAAAGIYSTFGGGVQEYKKQRPH